MVNTYYLFIAQNVGPNVELTNTFLNFIHELRTLVTKANKQNRFVEKGGGT
jgi:hypothetical protein